MLVRRILEVLEHGSQERFRAGWIFHEEPIGAVLIVDAESVAVVGEVDPHLGHIVADERREPRSREPRHMVPQLAPTGAQSKLAEVSGAFDFWNDPAEDIYGPNDGEAP